MIKKFFKYAITCVLATLVAVAPASAIECIDAPAPAKCSSILPEEWCEEGGVIEILDLVLNILTAGISVLAVVGIVITAVQWITARDKEDQIKKAKSRLLNIVIGLVTWVLLWSFLSWILPGGVSTTAPDLPTAPEVDNGCPPGQIPAPVKPENPPSGSNSGTNPSPGPGTVSDKPIGNPTDSSVDIPCDPRTKDKGIADGWRSGKRTDYRICEISWSGRTATLNSRVAGAFYSMVQAAKADGIEIKVSSSFRTFDKQMELCGLNSSQKASLNRQRKNGSVDPVCNKSRTYVAPPGYSPHQSGTAIDFRGDKNSKMYTWLKANSTRFGFANYTNEHWHYDTSCSSSRNWHGNKPSWCK